MVERKYTLRRLSTGTYLLRGNDGESLWLLRKEQDGPSYGHPAMSTDRWAWSVYRWFGQGKPSREDIETGELRWWDCIEQWLETRREAVAIVVDRTSSASRSDTGDTT